MHQQLGVAADATSQTKLTSRAVGDSGRQGRLRIALDSDEEDLRGQRASGGRQLTVTEAIKPQWFALSSQYMYL